MSSLRTIFVIVLSVICPLVAGCLECDDPYAHATGESVELVLVPDADGLYPPIGGRMAVVQTSSREDIYRYGVWIRVQPFDATVGQSNFAIVEVDSTALPSAELFWISGESLTDTELSGGVDAHCDRGCSPVVDFTAEIVTDYSEPIRVVVNSFVSHLDCETDVAAEFELAVEVL